MTIGADGGESPNFKLYADPDNEARWQAYSALLRRQAEARAARGWPPASNPATPKEPLPGSALPTPAHRRAPGLLPLAAISLTAVAAGSFFLIQAHVAHVPTHDSSPRTGVGTPPAPPLGSNGRFTPVPDVVESTAPPPVVKPAAARNEPETLRAVDQPQSPSVADLPVEAPLSIRPAPRVVAEQRVFEPRHVWSGERLSTPQRFRPQAPFRVVREFYDSLFRGDGDRAAALVAPEERGEGPLSATQLSRFYRTLRQPMQITDMYKVNADNTVVRYAFGLPGGRRCVGAANVTTTERDGEIFVREIRSRNAC